MSPLPLKLKKDSIIEAVLEIRFDCSEVPEIVVGRLTDNPDWKTYVTQPLPTAELPQQLRRADPDFHHLAILERHPADRSLSVRIGEKTLAISRLSPYPDWPVFGPELLRTADFLFSRNFAEFKATRFGLRYMNAFTQANHGIQSVHDLNLNVEIQGKPLGSPFILSFQVHKAEDLTVLTKVAAREFVVRPDPSDMNVLVDIDAASPREFAGTADVAVVKAWIERAHTALKEEYFSLFTDNMRDALIES
jgi:uncharacterized protein (TIGR04255 family)